MTVRLVGHEAEYYEETRTDDEGRTHTEVYNHFIHQPVTPWIEVLQFPDQLSAGTYTFPFSIKVPFETRCSIRSQSSSSAVALTYHIHAQIAPI